MDPPKDTKENKMSWSEKKKKASLISFRLYLHTEKPEELQSHHSLL